jgi:hypothetical protein
MLVPPKDSYKPAEFEKLFSEAIGKLEDSKTY